MPMYCFHCDACGRDAEVFRPMAEAATGLTCCCGVEMQRDKRAERGSVHAFQAGESQAMGVPQCVLEKCRFDHEGNAFHPARPDVPMNPPGIKYNPKTGGLMINSARELRQATQKLGFTDYGA